MRAAAMNAVTADVVIVGAGIMGVSTPITSRAGAPGASWWSSATASARAPRRWPAAASATSTPFGGRRMTEGAARLVDGVLPRVPVRQ
jgi:hypothetical protein